MEKTSDTKTISSKYVKSSNYLETYATGVWGTINQKKNLQITFFEEMIDTPLSSEQEVIMKESKIMTAVKDVSKPHPPEQIRVLKCTITLNADLIDSLINWLTKRKEQLEKIK